MSKISPASVEAGEKREDDVVTAKVKRKWQSYIWDTLDKSPEERRLLFKLDAALLSLASLGTSFEI